MPKISRPRPFLILVLERPFRLQSLIYRLTIPFRNWPFPHEFSKIVLPYKESIYPTWSSIVSTISSGVKIWHFSLVFAFSITDPMPHLKRHHFTDSPDFIHASTSLILNLHSRPILVAGILRFSIQLSTVSRLTPRYSAISFIEYHRSTFRSMKTPRFQTNT